MAKINIAQYEPPYVLDLTDTPTSDHTAVGIKLEFTANEDQAFGDVCRIDSDGEAHLVDASVIASSSGLVMCVSTTVTAGNTGTYLLLGIARDDTWAWTVGGLIYITITGTTGNTLSQTKPTATNEVVQVVGYATHADRMLFYPQLVQVELA